MILRDALDIRRGTAQRNKIYKGTYKVWDRNKKALEGYCKQGELPSEYQQVEYIESTGTQYIDTGLKAIETLAIETESEFSQSSAWQRIWGMRGTGNKFQLFTTGNSLIDFTFTIDNNFKFSISEAKNKIKFVSGTGVYVNDDIVVQTSETYSSNNGFLALFAGYDRFSYLKLYSCKIWDNDVLVRNFIPCYRKSDNIIGLYDTVNNVFYTNAGTGTFLKGNDVPNPDYPQEIEVMQGRQIVTIKGTQYIVDLKSKNLFDKDNANIVNGWIYIATMRLNNHNGNRMFYIPCEPNTTYTISRSIITSSFRVATYDNTTFPTPTDSNVDYTISNYIENNNGTSITITTGANAKFLIVHYGKIEDTNMEQSLASIQVEKGSTATPFDPYYNYKLAGIGDYKDNIYTDKGKWYFKQNIGNVVLNGINKLFSTRYSTNTNNYYRFVAIIDNILNQQSGQVGNIISDKLIAKTIAQTYRCTQGIAVNDVNNQIIIYADIMKEMSVNEANEWLSINNILFYYVLQTPTVEEITAPTLINQLNALYQAM